MDTRIAPPVPAPPVGRGRRSRYELGWSALALAAAAVLVALAILQSPPLPLLGLVVGLAALGGLLFVTAPATTPLARRQYAGGALAVAGLVLVAVGIGHHVTVGLAVVGLLGCSSPWTLRWITSV
jgi:hypothetical protein